MKIKKILSIAGIVLIAILIISVVGLYIWSATGTYPSGEIAAEAMQSSSTVKVSTENWIIFSPEVASETGIVFYPGGLVEPEAYAPVLHQLAENGYLVVITPMPLNLAIFNTNAANAVFDYYPEITTWLLVGHSLGGASAGIYAENYTDRIDGLVFWDSYPPDSSDLSDNDIPVLSIFGTTNGIPNTDNFDDKRNLVPDDTIFFPIEGASHAQFGDYGPQKGDVVPSISAEEQHDIVVDRMLEFIDFLD